GHPWARQLRPPGGRGVGRIPDGGIPALERQSEAARWPRPEPRSAVADRYRLAGGICLWDESTPRLASARRPVQATVLETIRRLRPQQPAPFAPALCPLPPR